MAGFIDCHVHYPQTQIIGAFGEQLIDWLNKYTFIAEQQFADKEHAREVARVFLQECLRAGTTSAAVYCTVHPQSVDAFFEESAETRNADDRWQGPDGPQCAGSAHRHSAEGLRRIQSADRQVAWQRAAAVRRDAAIRGEQHAASRWRWPARCGTSIPAPTCSRTCPRIAREVAWVKELYPERSGYLDIYDHYRQLGPRSIYGHGIWLTEQELQRCHESGTAIAHCPTSNQFLGSGLFNMANAMNPARPVRVGLATDIGAGTSFSMLQTLNEAYKVAQLNGNALSAGHAFYLATRGTAKALYLDRQDRQRRGRHGSRRHRARSQVDTAHRVPHAVLQRHS